MNTSFRELEPPPGGLLRLRARLHERAQTRRRLTAWTVCVCVFGLGALLWARATPQATPDSVSKSWASLHPAVALAQDEAATWRASTPDPGHVAIEHVSAQAHVTYYRVGVLPAAQSEP